MPRQQPNDNQHRVIIRGKTRTIGTPPARVERPAPNPERGMARSESDGARVAVAPSRRAAEAPPLKPGERAPAVPLADRKGRGFPDRILALEEDLAEVQAFRADAAKVISDLCAFKELAEEQLASVAELAAFKADISMALHEYAGRVGALEGFESVLVQVLAKHGITLEEPPAAETEAPKPAEPAAT